MPSSSNDKAGHFTKKYARSDCTEKKRSDMDYTHRNQDLQGAHTSLLQLINKVCYLAMVNTE